MVNNLWFYFASTVNFFVSRKPAKLHISVVHFAVSAVTHPPGQVYQSPMI
jgi:hypothetical protein